MKSILILLLASSVFNAKSQTNNTFFLGHSLINFNVPNIVDKLSIESFETFSYDANIGNGASLNWHWNNPTTGEGDQWDLTLPNGGYENFIITEAVPLKNQLNFTDTYRYADSLYAFAAQYSPNVQYYMYETWHCINSGNGSTAGSGGTPCDWDPESTIDWRSRLDLDLSYWESIADSINLIHSNEMLIIPCGQAMARLADSIAIGAIPGLSSIFDLFVDEHHLDDRGNYFVACVVYSVIHGVSPEGLPNQLTNRFGSLYTVYPTVAQAEKMQEIAWETVCDYPRDGVNCTTSSLTEINSERPLFKIYPVPANNELTIQFDNSSQEIQSYTIMDQLGNNLLSGNLESFTTLIDLTELSIGIYFIQVNNEIVKFVKGN